METTTPNPTLRRIAFALAALSATVPALAIAAGEPTTVHVYYGDLNLTSEAGIAALLDPKEGWLLGVRTYWPPILWSIVLLVIVAIIMGLGGATLQKTLIDAMIKLLVVIGLYVFIGNSGILSFGHIGFMMIGAYAAAWQTCCPRTKKLFIPGLPDYLLTHQFPFMVSVILSGLLPSQGNSVIAAYRANGLVLIPALAVEAWLQWRVDRRVRPSWVAIAGVAIGFGVYLAVNANVYGDPFAFAEIQRTHWYKDLSPPWEGIGGMIEWTADPNPDNAFMIGWMELVFTGLGTYSYVTSQRAKAHVQAEQLLASVDRDLEASDAARLEGAEKMISKAFELESRSPHAALTWLHYRQQTLGGRSLAAVRRHLEQRPAEILALTGAAV